METQIVDKVVNPSKQTFETYILESKPFIWLGLVESWPAYKNWHNVDYLRNVIGANTVVPLRTHFTKEGDGSEWLGEEKKLPFGEFIDHWKENKVYSKSIE
jgi:hypothetical protein